MPYGDIILQAETTQFRINRDVLAKHSPVFEDMFAVPQPLNEPTMEGCSIVHVSDTAKDWELLLEMLYDPFRCEDTLPFDLVASMLRLGRKYEFKAAKENAKSRIHHEFPAKLDSWIEVEMISTKIEFQEGFEVDLLNLVYECEITSSIPVAAFSLSSYVEPRIASF
ncbi:hypothetical protein MVEN_00743400 [Mycena venus]|uniref:BTB domain-containing protein n=1 Tax=Mycena venus TaxID=2733690 RepID=A0A8H6YJI0_9AGAR|nr:hypothetical protein MVEN_00743400 [Mycena venus]